MLMTEAVKAPSETSLAWNVPNTHEAPAPPVRPASGGLHDPLSGRGGALLIV